MRYGLPREDNPKKKWKIAVEDELRNLKMEVFFLKDQLNAASKKLAEFTSSKPPDPFAFIRGFSKNENSLHQLSYNIANTSSTNEAQPSLSTDHNGNKNQRTFTVCSSQSSLENPFASIERPHYQTIWDYDPVTRKAVRLHSISCMPFYHDDKSFEELRYEDYVLKGIGFSNQIQRYKDSALRSTRTERPSFSFTSKNWKPLERKKSANMADISKVSLMKEVATILKDADLKKMTFKKVREEIEKKLDCDLSNRKLEIDNLVTQFLKEEKDVNNHNTSSFMIPWYITPKLPKAPWPFGPSLKRSETSNLPASNNIASDVNIMTNAVVEQNKPEHVFNFQSSPEPKNIADAKIIAKDENLLSQVLLELRKMGEKVSLINDQLLKMDSNLSDVSSRVNVMDSRLSAVDMFITMQRFDKKWEGLETRLAVLETPTPAEVDKNIGKAAIQTKEKDISLFKNVKENDEVDNTSFDNWKHKNKQTTSQQSHNSATTTRETSIKIGTESFSALDTSDMNVSDFVRSISCTDITLGSKSLYTSTSSNHSSVSDSSSRVNTEIPSFEMANLKSNSLHSECSSIEDSSNQENESMFSHSGSVPLVSANIGVGIGEICKNEETQAKNLVMSNQLTGAIEQSKLDKKLEPKHNNKSNDEHDNNGTFANDPLGVIEQKDSPSKPSHDLLGKEIENDTENDFIIVEKSDIEEPLEEHSKTTTPHSAVSQNFGEASSSSDCKIYNDITEYLEINLGKKKHLVYEFGFEAKPDYLLDSEGTLSYETKLVETESKKAETESKKAETCSRDDSFHQFRTNFIENKSVDNKQSSPFVVFQRKPPEDSSGKNFPGKNC